MKKIIFIVIFSLLFLSAYQKGGNNPMKIKLHSNSFSENGYIPSKFTCDGKDISPQLSWSNIPEGTKSIAIICDDPDAPMGTWVHWVIYNIPPDKRSLQENFPKVSEIEDGTHQGINDFRKIGYNGPCPPPGKAHRYFFKIYALDIKINENNLTMVKLLAKIEGHILGYGELIGLYKR